MIIDTLLLMISTYCNFIFTAYVVGFVMFNFASIIFTDKASSRYDYDFLSRKIFPYAVLVYLLFFSVLTYYLLHHSLDTEMYRRRILGEYYFAYWIHPVLFVCMAILNFWRSKSARIMIVLIGIVATLPMEKLIIVMSLHRDYLPSPWISSKPFSYMSFAIEILVGCILAFGFYMIFLWGITKFWMKKRPHKGGL